MLGVGEQVVLTSDLGYYWSVIDDGSVDSHSGNAVTFTAGSRGGEATVIVTGFHNSCSASSLRFSIVAPTAAYYNDGQFLHHVNEADIGVGSYIYFGPNTVSFYRAYMQEAQATTSGSGVWSCRDGAPHEPAPFPIPALISVGPRGTQLNGMDMSYSGSCIGDPYQSGSETINIPVQYAVGGPGPWSAANTIGVSSTATTAGNLFRTKSFASWTTTVTSPTVGGP
jgi:hypothetical protein